jgi:ATP-dependent protease HslVU (ClpYQ) ATPase subunit
MSNQDNSTTQQQIRVRYNETSALFASQFIVNTSAEDVTINFSSGPLSDPGSGDTMLPVHTRIAMTREGARRLHAVLSNILAPAKKEKEDIPAQAQASIPDIKQ